MIGGFSLKSLCGLIFRQPGGRVRKSLLKARIIGHHRELRKLVDHVLWGPEQNPRVRLTQLVESLGETRARVVDL